MVLEGLRRRLSWSGVAFEFVAHRSLPAERAWLGHTVVAGHYDLHSGSPRWPTNVTVLNRSLANDSFSVTFYLGFLLHFL